MRMEHGHCAALEIRTHPDGAPEYFCTAYERRPQICRDLARGSPECAGERARTAADAAGREKIPDGSPWRAAARPLQATTDLPSL
jgi:hypothetical protein